MEELALRVLTTFDLYGWREPTDSSPEAGLSAVACVIGRTYLPLDLPEQVRM